MSTKWLALNGVFINFSASDRNIYSCTYVKVLRMTKLLHKQKSNEEIDYLVMSFSFCYEMKMIELNLLIFYLWIELQVRLL